MKRVTRSVTVILDDEGREIGRQEAEFATEFISTDRATDRATEQPTDPATGRAGEPTQSTAEARQKIDAILNSVFAGLGRD